MFVGMVIGISLQAKGPEVDLRHFVMLNCTYEMYLRSC